MSRTSEKNSETKKTDFWRRSVASVTDFGRNYRERIFVSTRWNIVLFHAVSVFVIILVIIGLLTYTNKTILTAVTTTIESALSPAGNVQPDNTVPQTLADLKMLYFIVLSGMIAFTVIGGYAAAHITLRPTRKAFALQKRFIADISHELRTPLAVMKVANEVALMGATSLKEMREVVATNLDEVDRMKGIINTILSFGRLEHTDALPFGNISLNAVLATVRKRLAPLASKRRVRLDAATTETDEIYVHGNKTALEQMAFNILKNAIVYTPAGGSVHVHSIQSAAQNGSSAQNAHTHMLGGFVVSDSGVGIAERELPHVFEPFFRSNTARTRKDGGGSGIGLSVVYEIVRLHGGQITLESAPGKGTKVVVLIPTAPDRRTLRAKTEKQERYVHTRPHIIHNFLER